MSTKRPFVPEDLYRIVQVSDPQIHPDGDIVAFVRSHVEGDKKEVRSNIWIAPFSTNGAGTAPGATPPSASRPYTRGPRRDGQPRWSPDGRRLAFVRQTGDGPDADRQIWIIERDGGEAWPLTTMRHGAGNPIWSPDGRRIAFVAAVDDDESAAEAVTPKTEANRKRDKQRALDEARLLTNFRYKFDHVGIAPPRRTHVWVVTVPDEPPAPGAVQPEDVRLARAEAAAAVENPQPDGSTDAASLPNGGPLPQQVTTEPFDHAPLDWSPDGRHIAVSASYEDERSPTLDVWIFPVPQDGQRTAEPATERTASPTYEAPVKLTPSDGVFYDARWSPCGQRLAVIGNLREHRFATLNRLWLYPAPGQAGERMCLTAEWDRGVGGTVNSDVRPGMSGVGLTWAPAGDAIYFVADDRGATQLYRARVPASFADEPAPPADAPEVAEARSASGFPEATILGTVSTVPKIVAGGPSEIYGFSLSRDGERAAIAVADMFNPGDIYALHASGAASISGRGSGVRIGAVDHSGPDDDRSAGIDSSGVIVGAGDDRSAGVDGEAASASQQLGHHVAHITAVNADFLAGIELPTVEQIEFESSDGLPIHGWIMRPVALEPGQKAPAVMQIHGGPHTCWGHSFSLEMHLQAALGYAVVFVNPRGSTSYGQQFARACLNDYGGRDYEDLMAAVDYALNLGYIDEQKLAVTGGSYGGFMTNWVVTQTDRFRAGIAHRSIANWISFWGVSDIGPRFMEAEFGHESLWAGFDDMWERSPLKHAGNVVTPLLLCHSEHDLRCPMEQAEQFYLALKWQGKTAELLRHPRSNHDLTRVGPPTLRVDRFQHIARFLAAHVTRDGGIEDEK